MELELFFWVTGMEDPITASLGEDVDLVGSFTIVHSSSSSKQGFSIFYDFVAVANRYNKLAQFIWTNSNHNLQSNESGLTRQDFVFPNLPTPDPEDWRSFLLSYSGNAPTTLNKCKDDYKLNKGANFVGETLFLIDLSQPIDVSGQTRSLTEALFNIGTDEFAIKLNKYQPTINNNTCILGDRQELEAEIKNLRILPQGTLPNSEEYTFTDLSIAAYND